MSAILRMSDFVLPSEREKEYAMTADPMKNEIWQKSTGLYEYLMNGCKRCCTSVYISLDRSTNKILLLLNCNNLYSKNSTYTFYFEGSSSKRKSQPIWAPKVGKALATDCTSLSPLPETFTIMF